MTNKNLIIPAMLAVVVICAFVLAAAPVQKASTVHGSIGTVQTLVKEDTDFDAAENLSITCTTAFVIESMIVDATNFAAADAVDLRVDGDGAGSATLANIILVADLEGTLVDTSITGQAGVGSIGGQANGEVQLRFATENDTGADGDDGEALEVTYVIRTGGACS